MIKETIQYTDFNDKNRTEVLYFNISKSELMDNLNLREELEVIQTSLEGPERELETHEIQRILNLVKKLMRLSFGRRSEDGLNFRKSDQIWDDFYSSAAYDAFIMSLFQNPEKAFEFLVAVMPKDLMEQARREIEENVVELPPHRNVFEQQEQVGNDLPEPGPVVDVEKEWVDFTMEELENMPKEQFEKLYNKIKGPKPGILVQIGMRRKGREI